MSETIELICTACDGLGEERRIFQPWSNVYGWYTRDGVDYYYRPCETCGGHGFRPSGSFVPVVNGSSLNQRGDHQGSDSGDGERQGDTPV